MEPRASRPYMPGYGIAAPEAGTGLLPWSWAAERLTASHDYWVATVCPDGRPHVMPVWAVWDGGCLWFSSSPDSRKARNLARDPRTTVTTDDPSEPVVLEAEVTRIRDEAGNAGFAERVNSKYGTDYALGFFLANATFRLAPLRAFGLTQEDFTGSPTRWEFA